MTSFVEVDGARLAYDVSGGVVGRGSAVLLLHAGIADRRMWDGQVAAWSAQRQVVRLDFRGFGETRSGPGRVAHHADAVAVLDAAGMSEAVVIGASMGGAVAADLVLTYPERVSGLVLSGSALNGAEFTDAATFDGWRDAGAAAEGGEFGRAAELEAAMWVPDATADVRRLVVEMLLPTYQREEPDEEPVPDAAERLAEIGVPTLVIVGERDRPDILRFADRLAAEIASARLLRLPGVGHLTNLEAPEPFNAAVAEFFAEVDER